MTTGYYCAIFPFCGGGKKKDDKKTKAFYDWATTGIPVIKVYPLKCCVRPQKRNQTILNTTITLGSS